MKKLNFSFVLLLTLFIITSCSKSNIAPPAPLNQNPPEDIHVKVKWQTKTGNSNDKIENYNLSPTYANNMVFVPSQNGKVYALDIENGKIIWKKDTKLNLSSQPSNIGNAIIFGSIKGDLVALDIKNGSTLWHTHMPSSLFSQPATLGNHIYAYTHDGSLSAFDAKDGSKKWSVSNNLPEITLPGDSSPIAFNNIVMVGTAFGTVLGFNADTGDRIINLPIIISHGGSQADRMIDITSSPIIYDDYLIFASYQGAIVALNKNNRKILWTKKSSIIHNFTINNGIVFTAQDNSLLKAFNIQNGDTVWTQNILKQRKTTGPIYYKGLIVVADYQGYLHFFNSTDGDYLGRFKLTAKSIFLNYGISGNILSTKKGIIVKANDGTTYLLDAHKKDKQAKTEHIKPKAPSDKIKIKNIKTTSSQNNNKLSQKELNINIIITDFSKK